MQRTLTDSFDKLSEFNNVKEISLSLHLNIHFIIKVGINTVKISSQKYQRFKKKSLFLIYFNNCQLEPGISFHFKKNVMVKLCSFLFSFILKKYVGVVLYDR